MIQKFYQFFLKKNILKTTPIYGLEFRFTAIHDSNLSFHANFQSFTVSRNILP